MIPEQKFQSEQIGEAFARQVLNEFFGAEVFVGPVIETKLHQLAHVIYQDVPEDDYFGATVKYPSGKAFVAINTHQSLRLRYFTAAHELWHVLSFTDMIDEKIDPERAADRFAAALMLPEALIRLLWGKLKKDVDIEKVVLMIADMSSAPYEAVARRIEELNLYSISKNKKLSEKEWISTRTKYYLTENLLDRPFPIKQFYDYEIIVEREMKKSRIDLFTASTKLAHTSPEKARDYQSKAMEMLCSAEEEGQDE